jgi:uncharacterized repeat protein (TIGR04138 family)
VRQALDFALKTLGERRHITGQELLRSISEFSRKRFGPLTRTVFEEWGILETFDFGRIVFELVEQGVMSKTDEDSIEDFRDGYDFHQEFEVNYDYLSEIRRSWQIGNAHSGLSEPGHNSSF